MNPDVEFPILVSPMAGFPGRCFGGGVGSRPDLVTGKRTLSDAGHREKC